MNLNETLSIAQAAAFLRVHPQTVRVAMRQNRLRARRLSKVSWMIELADVERSMRYDRNINIRKLVPVSTP